MNKLWWHTKSAVYWIGFKWSGDTVAWLPGIGWGRARRSTVECDRSSDRIGSGSTPDVASKFILHWCDWRKPCPICKENKRRKKMT